MVVRVRARLGSTADNLTISRIVCWLSKYSLVTFSSLSRCRLCNFRVLYDPYNDKAFVELKSGKNRRENPDLSKEAIIK